MDSVSDALPEAIRRDAAVADGGRGLSGLREQFSTRSAC